MHIAAITNPFSGSISCKPTTASTMLDAKANLQHGALYLTDHQQAGVGRLQERTWLSHPSDLTFSLALAQKKTTLSGPLPLLVALALAKTLQHLSIKNITIKWPNDLLINEEKIAGILCQAQGDFYIIGIGLNIAKRTQNLSTESQAYPAVGLLDVSDMLPSKELLLNELLQNLHNVFSDTNWLENFNNYLYRPSQAISYQVGDTRHSGFVKSVLADGALLLQTPSQQVRLYAGEVVRS
jgi:biotin-[acetyl-CoA-carboxylase] ligase BirA-like protein